MPVAHTEQFGDLEYPVEAELWFPRGLPGFEQHRRFVLLNDPAMAPIVHLQSLENAHLCFVALPVRSVAPDYESSLSTEDRETLGGATSTLELALLAAAAGGHLTANLLAPVVIDLTTRRAVQAVRWDRRYSHVQELEAACS